MTTQASPKPLGPKLEATTSLDDPATPNPATDGSRSSTGSDPSSAVVSTSSSGDDERSSDGKADDAVKRLSKSGLPKKYFCKSCNQGFTRKHNMISHELIHSTVKPHQCSVCSLKFRRIHDLKRHEKLHTGEKPHVCKRCNKKFTRNDALARHQNSPNACIPVRGGDRDSPDDSSSGNGSSSADSNNTRASSSRPSASSETMAMSDSMDNLPATVSGTTPSCKSESVDAVATTPQQQSQSQQSLPQPPPLQSRHSKSHFTTTSFDKPQFAASPSASAVPTPSHLQQSNLEYSSYNRINDLPQPKVVSSMVFPNNPYSQFVPQVLHNPPTSQNGHKPQLVPSMVLDNGGANGSANGTTATPSSATNGSVPPHPQPPASSSMTPGSTAAVTPGSAPPSVTSPEVGPISMSSPPKHHADVGSETGKYVPIEKYQDLLKYVKKMELEVRTQRERIQELERSANEQKIIVRYLEDREHDQRRSLTHDNHKKHTKSSDSDDSMEKPASKRRGLDDDDDEDNSE